MHSRSRIADARRRLVARGRGGEPLINQLGRSRTRRGRVVELVECDGIIWRRYPESPVQANRYFITKFGSRPDILLLHRWIYEYYVGDIPAGFVVHHLNGDVSDNRPRNLAVATNSEHMRGHKNVHARLREGCAAWARSHPDLVREYAGRAGRAYWSNPRVVQLVCATCGVSFSSLDVRDNRPRYCSRRCRALASKTKRLLCQWCGAEFHVHSSVDAKFCCRRCAACFGGHKMRSR